MNRSARRRQKKLERKSRQTGESEQATPVAIQQAIEQAMQHHGAGRLAEAEAIYQQILRADPNQPEALHLLGVIAHQVGKNDTAAALIGQAIAIKPDYPAACNNLGIALKELGKFDEAVAVYRQALASKPDYAEAFSNLGVALREQGNMDEAVANFRQSIALKADAEVCNNLGNTLEAIGQLDEAVVSQRQALAIKPDYPGALNSLANALKEQGKLDEAAANFKASLAIRPDPEVFTSLGCVLADLDRPDEAMAHHGRAIEINPDYAEAHYNLGNALRDLGRLDQAMASYRRAFAIKPDLAEAYHNHGVVLQDLNRLDEAMASYHEAIAIRPDYPEPRCGLGHAQLLRGEFADGWKNYAWRWQTKDYAGFRRDYDAPAWDGGDFDGKTLLLYREQGLGDFIQFVRYAPLAAARGGRVVVEAPPKLKCLFAAMEGVDAVIETGQQPPSFDLHAPLLDLPWLLGTRLETIPAGAPYIGPAPELVNKWRSRLAARDGLRIGLVWGGNPEHKNDKYRSMDPALLEPLLQISGVTLFSLQVGRDGEAADTFGDRVIDLMPEAAPFDETAAVMMNLDIVISIDSSSAHLAGALGRPVWTLLSYVPDWRWMLDRDDSPWYPSMRLFRQETVGDWGGVVERVCRALAQTKNQEKS